MMLGDAAADGAIASVTANLANKANALRAKYASGIHTYGELLADVDHWWYVAAQMADTAANMNGWTPWGGSTMAADRLHEIQDASLALLELRGYLKTLQPNVVIFDPIELNQDVAMMVAPIEWISGVSTTDLANTANFADAVKSAANAPSTAIGYILDQAVRSLKLPSWTVPALAGTALVGLGAWAYFTFLAPVARVSHRLANPRKRRRRHA